MREVDEAVRQDELSNFMDKYGKPLIAAIVLGLAAFAGYLYWDAQQEAAMEKDSETLISAMDQLEANNFDTANSTLEQLIAEGGGGAKAASQMLQGGIAQQQGKPAEAAERFAAIAADGDAPQTLRDLATVREVAATFDLRTPADVVARLSAIAVPENAYFGSAGEMVAIAYLEQGKRAEAGALLAQIAQADDVPESLRSRARQLAGVLGVDAIEDVDEVLEELEADGDTAAPATE
ncbi:tetratricopeptide repeat protein [Altererythrobacter aestiaquae]|uniref:Ancillary SecYEG translocon subunit n=2 Tax=Pontixanthobacter aestiaquae TaxID=1509367 RepID=A0A844Z5X7_9SPHN|nr:tetratricopeptide repeat protein [Pontixanthobacter aestiaquae]